MIGSSQSRESANRRVKVTFALGLLVTTASGFGIGWTLGVPPFLASSEITLQADAHCFVEGKNEPKFEVSDLVDWAIHVIDGKEGDDLIVLQFDTADAEGILCQALLINIDRELIEASRGFLFAPREIPISSSVSGSTTGTFSTSKAARRVTSSGLSAFSDNYHLIIETLEIQEFLTGEGHTYVLRVGELDGRIGFAARGFALRIYTRTYLHDSASNVSGGIDNFSLQVKTLRDQTTTVAPTHQSEAIDNVARTFGWDSLPAESDIDVLSVDPDRKRIEEALIIGLSTLVGVGVSAMFEAFLAFQWIGLVGAKRGDQPQNLQHLRIKAQSQRLAILTKHRKRR